MNIPRNHHTRTPGVTPGGTLAAVAAIGVLAAGGLLYSLRPAHSGGKRANKPIPFQMLVAVDRSGSESADQRDERFGPLDEIVDTLLPNDNAVTLWSFGRTADKEWGPGSIDKAQDLWGVEDDIINRHSKERGTYMGKALDEMLAAARAAQQRGEPVACLVLGSGETTDDAETSEAARELSQLPNVKAVWLAGAKEEEGLRTSIEKTLSPLGQHLVVSGPYDTRQALDRFRGLVNE